MIPLLSTCYHFCNILDNSILGLQGHKGIPANIIVKLNARQIGVLVDLYQQFAILNVKKV